MEVKNYGKFIGRAEAEAMLEKNVPKKEQKDQYSRVYGHLFGLDNVREFMNKIEAYNRDPSNKANEIAGVRVYRVKNLKRQEEKYYLDKSGGDKEKVPLKDILMVPVTKDGKDLYHVCDNPKVDPSDVAPTNDNILTEPLPCPNFCNGGPQ
ncbi:MAG: hypothetical protein OEX02_08775 [Cyclobacteriaceae bacterium]|nr:hypothetical protein [Cyclobacteriaceae bacterium]